MATYPRDRVADVVIDGGTPYEARLQDDRPPRRSCPVHHRPAALQKLATWAVLVGCPRQRRTARSMSAMPGREPLMSKPVQHAAIARSHRSGLLCAFCPSALAHPFTANIRRSEPISPVRDIHLTGLDWMGGRALDAAGRPALPPVHRGVPVLVRDGRGLPG